jgi:saccharopine dehydrogenase (NAD+, L-lysine-forming)
MRVLLVGAGGVGAAAVGIAARRDFYDEFVVADYDIERARTAVAGHEAKGFVAARLDASSAVAVGRPAAAGSPPSR